MIVSSVDRVVPPKVPEMVAVVDDAVALVVMVKPMLSAPEFTVTLDGTVAAALLLDRVTVAPLVGGGH